LLANFALQKKALENSLLDFTNYREKLLQVKRRDVVNAPDDVNDNFKNYIINYYYIMSGTCQPLTLGGRRRKRNKRKKRKQTKRKKRSGKCGCCKRKRRKRTRRKRRR
jgi:hypothetical protein